MSVSNSFDDKTWISFVFIGNPFLRWGFLIGVLILLRTFVLILVVFRVFFLTKVVVNHLKMARGEIWPKHSEKNNNKKKKNKSKKLPRWGQKSTIKLILGYHGWIPYWYFWFNLESQTPVFFDHWINKQIRKMRQYPYPH